MKVAIGTLTFAIALFCAVPQPAHAATQATMQSDSTMSAAVLSKINSDKELKTHEIKAVSKAGVVTLSGTVHNEGEKTRAAELAKAAGATVVDNMITINANATAGTTGTVDKTEDAAKKAADKTEDVAQKAWQKTKDGWEVVVDKTEAAAKAVGDEVTDAWIITAVKTKFVGEDALKDSDINVDASKHVVTLKGTVASEAGRDRAIDIVKHTDGVNRIIDALTIGPKK